MAAATPSQPDGVRDRSRDRNESKTDQQVSNRTWMICGTLTAHLKAVLHFRAQ